jgi:hypothetical protein
MSRPFRTLLMAGIQNTPKPTAVVHNRNAATRIRLVDIRFASRRATRPERHNNHDDPAFSGLLDCRIRANKPCSTVTFPLGKKSALLSRLPRERCLCDGNFAANLRPMGAASQKSLKTPTLAHRRMTSNKLGAR